AASPRPTCYTLRIDPAAAGSPELLPRLLALTEEALTAAADAWLKILTACCGAILPSVADEAPPELRKAAREYLFRHWFTVERGAAGPPGLAVAAGTDGPEDRKRKLKAALRARLLRSGLSEDRIAGWLEDLDGACGAAFGEDCVVFDNGLAFERLAIDLEGRAQALFRACRAAAFLPTPRAALSGGPLPGKPFQRGLPAERLSSWPQSS
ncbi:MAG: hypothetical protein LBW85_01740, partial [Deltaproteobacteria bacterium]|nr:hypothetical protein [Deltaproteobacteria bacterium]